jgi:hypothetical protein
MSARAVTNKRAAKVHQPKLPRTLSRLLLDLAPVRDRPNSANLTRCSPVLRRGLPQRNEETPRPRRPPTSLSFWSIQGFFAANLSRSLVNGSNTRPKLPEAGNVFRLARFSRIIAQVERHHATKQANTFELEPYTHSLSRRGSMVTILMSCL